MSFIFQTFFVPFSKNYFFSTAEPSDGSSDLHDSVIKICDDVLKDDDAPVDLIGESQSAGTIGEKRNKKNKKAVSKVRELETKSD